MLDVELNLFTIINYYKVWLRAGLLAVQGPSLLPCHFAWQPTDGNSSCAYAQLAVK